MWWFNSECLATVTKDSEDGNEESHLGVCVCVYECEYMYACVCACVCLGVYVSLRIYC